MCWVRRFRHWGKAGTGVRPGSDLGQTGVGRQKAGLGSDTSSSQDKSKHNHKFAKPSEPTPNAPSLCRIVFRVDL